MEGETFLRRIRKTGTSLGINIPSEVVVLLKLQDGDLIRAEIQKVRRRDYHQV